MSLNITNNLLNTLKGFYDPSKGNGKKYTGSDEGISTLISAYGVSGVNDIELTNDNLSKQIFDGGVKVTVSSLVPVKFSYKIDEETHKIIIFGNNLTITVDENNQDLIEVVGISNEINGTSNDDKITLFGYDNTVKADSGNDTVTVYGEDNKLKDSEVNIFKGVGGQYLIVDDKEFLAYINNENDVESSTLTYEKTQEGIKFSSDNMKIIAQSDVAENIELEGNNNYIDTSVGADDISVKGDSNVIVTGIDGEVDTITVNGKGNQIIGGDEDKVNYGGTKGTVSISADDTSQHYIKITDSQGIEREYLIERNVQDSSIVEISYEINENDEVIFTGNNAKIIVQSDEENKKSDKISIIGDNNYLDSTVGDDEIEIIGDGNVVITGEGSDKVNINGTSNQVIGDKNDKVFYTATSGSVVITPEDESAHYINVGDYSYLVQRNNDSSKNVTFSYKLTASGVFEFEGDYFKIIQQNDDVEDNVKIKGNYTYVDTGDGNDRINVTGNNNIIHAGEGDDNVAVIGNNNEAYGDKGQDGIALKGENNKKEGFEFEDKIIVLNSENQFESVTVDGKKYTFGRTEAAKKEEKEVTIIVQNRKGVTTIEADNVSVTAEYNQEDVINFIGNNSKIFTRDKDDIINVIGDGNYIDGWTGDDKITVTGQKNKVYGFLGDDDITVNERENTDDEIIEEYKNIALNEDTKEELTPEEILEQAKINAKKNGANYVNGEFDSDTVNASYYTDIDNVKIYKSLKNQIKMGLNESEKQIVVDGKTYTITNYITYESTNPFKIPRTISYEMVDVTDENGNIQKQLQVVGDYISVKAEDGQDDNILVIGESNKIDMSDGDDYIQVQGKYNRIFAGIGDDKMVVKGDNNTITGGDGHDKLYVDGENSIWNDVEEVYGNYETKYTLTNKEREKTIVIENGLEYTIKANISEEEEMTEDVSFTYSVKDGVLNITGNKIHIIAKSGQTDNIKITGDDCVIELGDGNDTLEAKGARNEVYGGKGDDILKLYGDSFKAFGGQGDDNIIISAVNSEIYADDERANGKNDKLTIMGKNRNTYYGFNKSNVTRDNSKGFIIINSENKSQEISYTHIDGKQVVINVESNILSPEKLADEIFVEYEIEDIKDENGNIIDKKLIIKGSSVSINLTNKSDKSITAKIIGSDMRFQTFSGSDNVEVEGNNNEILVGEGIDGKADGQNTVTVKGDANKIYGGMNIDIFTVNGKNNQIYGGGSADELNLVGEDNTYQVSPIDFPTGGSLIINQSNQPQMFVIKGKTEEEDRIYKISLYNIEKANLPSANIKLQYYIDKDGYVNFVANNLKIEIVDNKTTQTTDEVTTNNRDYIRLTGNYCYISGGYGSDIILVNGNNNVIDGWDGDDSIVIEEGNNNEIRGFDGDDKITIKKGDNNNINGENGNDTLDIFEGTENKYVNIEKVTKK